MKVLKVICGIIGFAGFFLLWGAFGGLEQNLCTEAEFWRIAGIGFAMMTFSALVAQKN